MQPTELGMKPLPDNLPTPNDDRTNQRIGADATPPAPGKLKSALEVHPIRSFDLGIHSTD